MSRSLNDIMTYALKKGTAALIVPVLLSTFTRLTADSADSVVVFNEIQYHPADETTQPEWIELHNLMGVTIDLSGWRFEGAGDITFAEGTRIPGHGFLLLTNHPDDPLFAGHPVYNQALTGRLANDGESLRLFNRSGRVMDRVRYRNSQGWPVGAGGSGATLTKLNEQSAETGPENWIASPQIGGTPGRLRIPLPENQEITLPLITEDADWRYFNTGREAPAGWASPQFDPAQWPIGRIPFHAGLSPENAPAAGPFAYWNLDEGNGTTTTEQRSGRESRLFNGVTWVMDSERGWVLEFDGVDGYVDTGIMIPQMTLENDFTWAFWGFSRKESNVNVIVGNRHRANGADFSPREFIKFTNGGLEFHRRATGEDILYPAIPRNEWVHHALVKKGSSLTYYRDGIALGKQQLSAGLENPQPLYFGGDQTRENWRGRLDDVALWNVALESDTIAQLADGTHSPETAPSPTESPANPGGTELPGVSTTSYYVTEFTFVGEPSRTELILNLTVDDGAAIYLNGTEIHRVNLRDSPLSFETLATDPIRSVVVEMPLEIPPGALRSGRNVMAVEVHQATAVPQAEDLEFGLTLLASEIPELQPNRETIQFNELSQGDRIPFTLEIVNRESGSRDLLGYLIRTSNGKTFRIEEETRLAPEEFLILNDEKLTWNPDIGETLFLLTPSGRTLLDAVTVSDRLQGRCSEAPSRWQYPAEVTFGFENPPQTESSIVINEIMYHPMEAATQVAQAGAWIELFNRGPSLVDLSNWRFDDGIDFTFPNETKLGPGGFMLIVSDQAAFAAVYPDLDVVGEWSGRLSQRGERLSLVDSRGNSVDELIYYDGGRWPTRSDGGGSSLELQDPRSDNQLPEAWAPSTTHGQWHEISYRGRGDNPGGDPTRYQEFIMGLLDEGEYLVDNISVLEAPDGAARELIQNGDFESGSLAFWRPLGNHHQAEVIDDPDDVTNKVLKVIATGPTEHMSNHLETTLRFGGSFIRVAEGRDYQISFRAKWLGGSNQLNTRLYFNRLAQTTHLPIAHAGGSPGAPNTTYQSNVGPTLNALSHSPAVPEPQEPVTVQVEAKDPDGVAGLTLHYSVGGRRFIGVGMQRSNNLWTAAIPGQEFGSVIQFYVAALDNRGVRSLLPAQGEDSAAYIPVADGQADLDYGDCQPNNLRITMKRRDIDRLHATDNVMSNERLGCTIIVNERDVYYNAGVRLKGSEHGRASNVRVGYNIRFPADHPFLGAHETIAVDRSGAGDQFSQREIMVKHAIHHAGGIPGSYDDLIRVIAPRPQHTGSAMLAKARFDREYLVNQFENGNQGSLYEYELIYVLSSTTGGVEGLKVTQPGEVHGVAVRNLNSNDKERYRWHWLLKNNRAKDDFDPIIRMVSAMGRTGDRYRRETHQLLDVDQWLRAFAIQVLFGIADNYASGSRHNAMFYQRPSDGKMLYFPWDMDFTFVRGASSSLTPNSDLNQLIAASGENRRDYFRHLWEILQTTFNPEYLNEWTRHYSCYLPNESLTRFDSYIRQRHAYALSEINRQTPPIEFSISTPNQTSVNGPSITLTGSGWLDVHELRIAEGGSVPIEWTDWNRWQSQVPIHPGLNRVALEALDRWGQRVGSDRIEIIGNGTVIPATRDNIAISELMYHPEDPDEQELAQGWTNAEHFEFIELINLNNEFSVDLGGASFIEGIRYPLPATILGPGERAVIAGNRAAFQARYGRETIVIGEYQDGDTNRLSNTGERLHLVDALGDSIAMVEWSDSPPWPSEADGQGYSLVALKPRNGSSSMPANWRASVEVGGSPLGIDSTPLVQWLQDFEVMDIDEDFDADGWNAAWEYLAGSDPRNPIDSPILQVQYDADANQLAIDIFLMTGRDDVQVQPRISIDLIEWVDRVRFHEQERLAGGIQRIRYVSEIPVSEAAAQYIRLDLIVDEGRLETGE